jgi:hypothetical protein
MIHLSTLHNYLCPYIPRGKAMAEPLIRGDMEPSVTGSPLQISSIEATRNPRKNT